MRVLHVGAKNYPPAHGGVEKVVYDISKSGKEADNYFFVEWEQPESRFVKVLRGGFFRQIRDLLALVRKEEIALVHFHKETFIPHAIVAWLSSAPTIITIHGCAWRVKRWPFPVRLALYILDVLACAILPRVVFVGRADLVHFSRLVFWRRFYHVPNGVEMGEYLASSDTTQFVYLGRISPEKNVLRLVEAFASGQGKLTVYGPFDKHNAEYGPQVMNAINQSANVSYGGVVPHTEVLQTLAKYNTFVSISFSEGMPVAVLEAASVGLNLVLSDIEQHRDLGFPDVSYVSPWAPKIASEGRVPSIANKSHVEAKFSLRETVDMYRSLYEEFARKIDVT